MSEENREISEFDIKAAIGCDPPDIYPEIFANVAQEDFTELAEFIRRFTTAPKGKRVGIMMILRSDD